MSMQPHTLRVELVQQYIKDFNETLIEEEEEFVFKPESITQQLVEEMNVEVEATPDHDIPEVIWNVLADEDIVPEDYYDKFMTYMNEQVDAQ